MDSDWVFFTPNTDHIYIINIYDDGNKAYEQYLNEWVIYGKWKGKRALINLKNPSIKINSISRWKIMRK